MVNTVCSEHVYGFRLLLEILDKAGIYLFDGNKYYNRIRSLWVSCKAICIGLFDDSAVVTCVCICIYQR